MDNKLPSNRFSPRQQPERLLAEQALSRAAGAPLVGGNCVRLLRDATENYPAWLTAIREARQHIHFENYILDDDETGQEFIASLAERAQAGVKVRLLYDWMGGLFSTTNRLLHPLIQAGGEVRVFNPLALNKPLAWLSRDHRKSLTVDGRIGFVTGVCVSQRWVGNPARDIPPWRDTGIVIEGPAVADVVAAFAHTWGLCGEALPKEEFLLANDINTGNILVRVIASSPYTSGLYRLDQLVAAMARQTLWLTDAYFVGLPTYTQALCAAAQDGVDVRLLVPGATDISLLSPFSRAGYRTLLEAGVRVYEWNGPMIHAKTAVADSKWARVGSSNLNVASWISNHELDVAIEDEDFAKEMEAMYLEDLTNATEIVLSDKRRIQPKEHRRKPRGSDKVAGVATAMRLGNTVAAAFQQQRILGAAESAVMLILGLSLLAIAIAGWYWPRLLALPIAVLSLWLGSSLMIRAWQLRQRRTKTAQSIDKSTNSS